MSILTAVMVTLMLPGVSSLDLHQQLPMPALSEVRQEASLAGTWDENLLSSDTFLVAENKPVVLPDSPEQSTPETADPSAPVLVAQSSTAIPDGPSIKSSSVAPIALMATPSVMAAMRPNIPAPEKPVHSFWDRTNTLGFAVHGAVRIADAVQSCALLNRPGRREVWLPVHSCSGIATYSLAMVPAQIGTSYLMHKRGHHQMERWVPYFWAAPSAAGFAVSLKAW